jgi:transcriptional regulator with XRE-family HTH domain
MSNRSRKDGEPLEVPETFGLLVREQRQALGISQAELARRLGVKPAYISIIEKNLRRPSLSLLQRMSDVLGVEGQALFLLSHPEAKVLLRTPAPSPASNRDGGWRSFTEDKTLLARHNIGLQELKVLAQVRKLGEIQHSRDFVYILNAIRQAFKA